MVTERTLLVLFGPSCPLDPIENILTNHQFKRVAHQRCVGEELEEAGLELGLGTGEIGGRDDKEMEDTLHNVLVLEGHDAVRRLRDLCGGGARSLNRNNLAYMYPDLKFHCSPSTSAAQFTIEALFPNLGQSHSTPPATSLPLTNPSISTPVQPTPKPFALSNANWATPPSINGSRNKDRLSPSIERALREVELREQQMKKSPLSNSLVREEPMNRGQEEERRVFVRKSPAHPVKEEERYPEADELSEEDAVFSNEEEEEEYEGSGMRSEEEGFGEELSILEEEGIEEEGVMEQPEQDKVELEVGSSLTTEADGQYQRPLVVAEKAGYAGEAHNSEDEDQKKAESEAGDSIIYLDEGSPDEAPLSPISIITSLVEDSHYSGSPTRPRGDLESSSASIPPFNLSQPQQQSSSRSVPAIEPRMTKAAALRLGIELPARTARPSNASSLATPTTRRVVDLPKSLASPSITPRMTKSAALRTGGSGPTSSRLSIGGAAFVLPSSSRRQSMGTAERAASNRRESLPSTSSLGSSPTKPKIEVRWSKTAALRTGSTMMPNRRLSSLANNGNRSVVALQDLQEEGVPATRHQTTAWGSERPRQSLLVASIAPPKIAPRLTKTAAMRTGIDQGLSRRDREGSVVSDDSSFSFEGVPGHKRKDVISVASTQRPVVEPRLTKAARLRAGLEVEKESAATPSQRRASGAGFDYEGVPGHPRRQSVNVAALVKPPSITPRLNRSAMLRVNPNDLMCTSSSSSRPRSSLGFLPRPSSAVSNTSSTTPMRLSVANSSSTSGARMTSASSPLITPRSNKAAALRLGATPTPSTSTTKKENGWGSTPRADTKHVKDRPSTVLSFVNDGKRALGEWNGNTSRV